MFRNEIDDSLIQPTQLHNHYTSRGPNHEMAAWKGGMNWNFICNSTHQKEYHYKTKSYMSQGAWPGCIYLFNIDVSRYFWIYIGLCIYQIYIYIYLLGLHEPGENDSSFFFNLCDVEVVWASYLWNIEMCWVLSKKYLES